MFLSAARDRALLYVVELSFPLWTGSRSSVTECVDLLYFTECFRVLTPLLIHTHFLNLLFPLAFIFSCMYSEKSMSVVFGELLHPFGK